MINGWLITDSYVGDPLEAEYEEWFEYDDEPEEDRMPGSHTVRVCLPPNTTYRLS